MEFLEKLYSQEYFAPVLFVIVAILGVLFIIVLILALRDAKKNKAAAANNNAEVNTFAPVNDVAQEVNVEIPVQNNIKTDDNIISSVDPIGNSFENVPVEAPVKPTEATPVNPTEVAPVNPVEATPINPTEVAPVNPVEIPLTNVGTNDIKVEESPVATASDVANAENDLDAIAATLLSEYQKENTNNNEIVNTTPEQVSPVYVTPNTLPVENNNNVEIPNLNDIPTPQPVRVTETSTVIDSSQQNIGNIPTEEYSINK